MITDNEAKRRRKLFKELSNLYLDNLQRYELENSLIKSRVTSELGISMLTFIQVANIITRSKNI